MLVDSHCHLDCIDLSEFDNNFEQLIKHTVNAGVEHMLCVSINLEKYSAMLDKVSAYQNISVSAGLHPIRINNRIPRITVSVFMLLRRNFFSNSMRDDEGLARS